MRLYDGTQVVTSFDSLVEPELHTGNGLAMVVDQGRFFVVNLESGTKHRRFDETVRVNHALLSDNGEQVLLFVRFQSEQQLWLWDNERQELEPLNWYEDVSFIQWEIDVDHRFYVITDQLEEITEPSLFQEVIDTASPDQDSLALFQYNVDTGDSRQIIVFDDKKPLQLLRRGERYFVEYEDETLEELIVR